NSGPNRRDRVPCLGPTTNRHETRFHPAVSRLRGARPGAAFPRTAGRTGSVLSILQVKQGDNDRRGEEVGLSQLLSCPFRKRLRAVVVGWVERSEAHHFSQAGGAVKRTEVDIMSIRTGMFVGMWVVVAALFSVGCSPQYILRMSSPEQANVV